MNLNQKKLLQWTPKYLAIFVILFWLIVLFVYDFGPFIAAATMIWFLLFFVTLLAWKNSLLGGSFYILLGILYLIFIPNSFSFISCLIASPFFIIGILFIICYSSQKRKKIKKFLKNKNAR